MQLAGAGDRVAAPTATPRSALARPAGLARLRISLALAILTSIAAASALWSYAPLSLSGRLVDIEGRPVAGATIRLLAGPRVDSSAVSDSGGRWALAGGHRIDAHQLLLSAPGFLPLAVAVGDEPSPSRRSFALHRLPDVAGSVVDESGAAVAGAEVAFEQPGRPGAWSVNTGGDGSFALARTLPPGVYQLTVTALDHDGWRTTVDLRADGQVSVAAVIPRQLGTIELTTNPSGLHPLAGRPAAGGLRRHSLHRQHPGRQPLHPDQP